MQIESGARNEGLQKKVLAHLVGVDQVSPEVCEDCEVQTIQRLIWHLFLFPCEVC